MMYDNGEMYIYLKKEVFNFTFAHISKKEVRGGWVQEGGSYIYMCGFFSILRS